MNREKDANPSTSSAREYDDARIVALIKRDLEVLANVPQPDLQPLLSRIGDAKVVLLGEATHGTREFYDLRAEITMTLIREKGFSLVTLEADWPDIETVNAYIHGRRKNWAGFQRFPEWMWRNSSFANFIVRLKQHNLFAKDKAPVSIFGLDLYSLNASLESLGRFIRKQMPENTQALKAVEKCLIPWQFDHSRYGLAVLKGIADSCEIEVLELLKIMHEHQLKSAGRNADLLSALQNARILRNAEEYYRTMCEGSIRSWNLRDRHMFETLLILRQHFSARDPEHHEPKIVVWAHNSHIGDAGATEMGALGELNVGQLCKSRFGREAYSIGFLTYHGTVTAANHWGGTAETKALLRARPDSYEALCHRAQTSRFFLSTRRDRQLEKALRTPRLERAVGVIYRPDSERLSHYFEATLPDQFDEICWIDETSAVEPLPQVEAVEEPDTYPFGL